MLVLLFLAKSFLFFVDPLQVASGIIEMLLTIDELENRLNVAEDGGFPLRFDPRETARADGAFRPVLWRERWE